MRNHGRQTRVSGIAQERQAKKCDLKAGNEGLTKAVSKRLIIAVHTERRKVIEP